MNDNPYVRLVEAMEPKEDDLDSIGTIISVKPLKIKIGDLEIDKNNILINPLLLSREERIIFKTNTETADLHSHKIDINKEGVKIYYKDNINLEKDDEVLIVRDGQFFIVVCKVISL